MAFQSIRSDGTRLSALGPSGIWYIASTSSADGVLDEFFDAYDRAFVLPNEKEGYNGFVDCLGLNSGDKYRRLHARYGAFREFVIVARAIDSTLIAGANLIVTALPARMEAAPLACTVNLNYIFVVPEARRKRYFSMIMREMPELVQMLFAHTEEHNPLMPLGEIATSKAVGLTYIFIEQNDPYRMSSTDYALDTKVTGLDQIDRIAVWGRQGAKVIDFPYVQPPLTSDQRPDANLVLAVLGCLSDSLPACVLRHHLERFFAISVLKGGRLEDDRSAADQLSALRTLEFENRDIRLFPLSETSRWPGPGSLMSGGSSRTLRQVLSTIAV